MKNAEQLVLNTGYSKRDDISNQSEQQNSERSALSLKARLSHLSDKGENLENN